MHSLLEQSLELKLLLSQLLSHPYSDVFTLLIPRNLGKLTVD